MAVVRKIVESRELAKVLELPTEMKDIKVEITVRPVKDKEMGLFDPKPFRGVLNIDNVQEQIKEIRDDWERY